MSRASALRFSSVEALHGDDATVKAVLGALDGATVGHLATHGRYRADNPLFSSLRLVDGELTVYELERLAQPPELVVLSACNAGLASVASGDELLGLSAALLACGTRTVVAAIAEVPDSLAGAQMAAYHRALGAGASPAGALVESRRAVDAHRASSAFLCFGWGG